jgi:ketosteroid isomerase-like protein
MQYRFLGCAAPGHMRKKVWRSGHASVCVGRPCHQQDGDIAEIATLGNNHRERKPTMSAVDAESFAVEWIGAWNSHGLERVLSHYADEIVFQSPLAQKLTGNGRVIGKAALRSYWGQALANSPNLKFDLIDVYAGFECVTITYKNHREQHAAETLEFGLDGKVVRSFACYA